MASSKMAAALTALIALGAAPALAQTKADLAAVRDVSVVEPGGGRILRDEVRIAAPPAAVWKALTDQAQYRAWVAPASFIDLRVGGAVEVSFDPKGQPGQAGNLKQEITAYLPQRLLVFRNVAQPPGLPGGAAYGRLAVVMTLEPAQGGAVTNVALSQVGYGRSADDDALYGFFRAHNPEYLASLKAFAERGSGQVR